LGLSQGSNTFFSIKNNFVKYSDNINFIKNIKKIFMILMFLMFFENLNFNIFPSILSRLRKTIINILIQNKLRLFAEYHNHHSF